MIARKFFISGLVQGVGFRFFIQRAAAVHQVFGYTKNLEDGRVEVFVEGEEGAVAAFHNDILVGPRYSRVKQVEELVADPVGSFFQFRIER